MEDTCVVRVEWDSNGGHLCGKVEWDSNGGHLCGKGRVG